MEYGYRTVTTRQLADACGLTQPALYHYFADKQTLYLAVVKEEIAKNKAALERIARRNEAVPERLRRLALYLLTTTQYDVGLMLHDIRYELSLEARTTLDELFQAGFIVPIASIFEDGIRQGNLLDPQRGGVDPITAAYLFMNMVSRFVTQQRENLPSRAGRQTTTEGSADLIVRVLLYGLTGPSLNT